MCMGPFRLLKFANKISSMPTYCNIKYFQSEISNVKIVLLKRLHFSIVHIIYVKYLQQIFIHVQVLQFISNLKLEIKYERSLIFYILKYFELIIAAVTTK